MNILIATVVGGLLAFGAVVGGVHVAQQDHTKLTDTGQLYQYSSK
jgi:hypothetical protein